MANPLAQLLLPKKPTPEEAAAVLAGDNPLAQMFQRGTVRGLNGETSTDFTPSAYNEERDATLARDEAEQEKEANARSAEVSQTETAQNPLVSSEADKTQADKLAIAGEPNRVLGQNARTMETDKYANLKDLLNMTSEPTPAASGVGAAPPRFKMNINSNLEPSLSEIPVKPLGALEQRSITSFKEAQPILDDLEKTLHPDQNQLLSLLKNSGAGVAYKSGISIDPATQSKTQLAGLLQVLGSSPYVVGSRSYQMIKLAMQHLTNPNQSDKFMQQQINEIRSLWPRMQDEILAAHDTPGSPLNQGASSDPYANPDYQPR